METPAQPQKRKRAYGTGSVSRDGSKHVARLPSGKKIGRFDSDEEANNVLDLVMLEMRERASGTHTVKSLGELYLKSVESLPSYRTIKSTWSTVVADAPFFNDPVSTLAPNEIEAWVATLPKHKRKRTRVRGGKRITKTLSKCIGHQTAKHALNYLRNAMQYAIKPLRAIETNPAEGIPLPEWGEPEDPPSVLSETELAQLFQFADLPLEQRTVFTLAIYQGPRKGELAGMTWDRIVWERCGWWITRSYRGKTKNKRKRWQVLLPVSLRALRVWWEHRGRPTQGVVFPSPRADHPGGIYSRSYDWGWQHHHEKTLSRIGWWHRAGIRTRIRFHDLRDTCASHLLSGSWGRKWTLEEVSKHLGHSSTKVTEKRYAHMLDSAMQRTAAATGDVLQWASESAQTSAQAASISTLPEMGQVFEIIDGAGSGGRTRDVQHGKKIVTQSFPIVAGQWADPGQIQALARDILRAVERGDAVPQGELVRFASAVLAGIPAVRLAAAVLQGGALARAAALELIDVTLSSSLDELATRGGSDQRTFF